MIYREMLIFTDEKLGFIEKRYDLSRNVKIYREKLGFTEKRYDLPRNHMIYQEKQKYKNAHTFCFLKKTDSFQNNSSAMHKKFRKIIAILDKS